MGLLPDTQNCGLRKRRECRERFPRHRLQRKPLVSDPGMHYGTCVTHVPWCMSVSLIRGGGENVPGIPGAYATRDFAYLGRGLLPWPWWRHQMETFSALLAICAGNSPVTGEFPAKRPVTRSFDVFFDLQPNTPLSKQSWGRWCEIPSPSLWRHCNGYMCSMVTRIGKSIVYSTAPLQASINENIKFAHAWPFGKGSHP